MTDDRSVAPLSADELAEVRQRDRAYDVMGWDLSNPRTGREQMAADRRRLLATLDTRDVGGDPQSFIPGYRIRYIELETVCGWLKDNGWSGYIGFDEAVKAMADAAAPDELRALSEAATPGEWAWMTTGSEGGTLYSPDTEHRPVTGRIARFTGLRATEDGAFAAAAVNYARAALRPAGAPEPGE